MRNRKKEQYSEAQSDLKSPLSPSERVAASIELSSAMGEIMLDNIRDRNPGINSQNLLRKARVRLYGK
jgi:hypothetical protein